MKIRNYKKTDRDRVEHIHFENGFLGKSLSLFLSNNKLWKSGIKYYLEREPESVFVLEKNGTIFGYLLGCLDDRKRIKAGIAGRLFKNFVKSIFLPKKDRVFWRDRFALFFRAFFRISNELKFKTPKNSGHFHIGLLPEARKSGYGTKLLKHFEDYARENGVKMIHADGYKTEFNPNERFWNKNGFKVYSLVKTSIWKKQLPKTDVFLICYHKKIA
jgi:GNAT superfamily N-acetyltransferase